VPWCSSIAGRSHVLDDVSLTSGPIDSLNGALANGKIARVDWSLTDQSVDTIIVADHKVHRFHASFNKLDDTDTTTEDPPCVGPIEAQPDAACPAPQLFVNGCPK
jgi:hypothetical protein